MVVRHLAKINHSHLHFFIPHFVSLLDPGCPLANNAVESLPLGNCNAVMGLQIFTNFVKASISFFFFTVTCGFRGEICSPDLSTALRSSQFEPPAQIFKETRSMIHRFDLDQ